MDLWLALMPKGAVLVFDEFPYLVEQDEALPSILQRIVDRLQDTGKKIIICGSSQRMMQGFVLKASEPLYGRAREILPIAPLKFEWMKAAFPQLSSWNRLKAYGVWGGVPRLSRRGASDWQGEAPVCYRPHRGVLGVVDVDS